MCVHVTQVRESGVHLKLNLCLHGAIINYAPRIGNYINKKESYIQFPEKRLKDTNINEIKNNAYVYYVMTVTPILKINKVHWTANSILRKVYERVHICTCSVQSSYYHIKTNHAFVYYIHFKPLHQQKCCGVLVDNKVDAHICLFRDNDRESKYDLKIALRSFFGGQYIVKYFYRITQ